MPGRQTVLTQRLESIREKTLSFVEHVSTAAVVNQCHGLFRMGPERAHAEHGLGSPVKQGLYLLALTLSTPEPPVPRELSESQWGTVFRHVKEASEAYVALFLPSDAELAAMGDEQRRRYAVVAPTFLHYFHTGELASGEQLLGRARAYFPQFDADLERIAHLSGTDAIRMVEWTAEHLQERLDRMVAWMMVMQELHTEYLRESWSTERLGEEVLRRREVDPSFNPTEDPLLVDVAAMAAEFGRDRTEAFCALFSVQRGELSRESFFAGSNPLDERPLIRVSADAMFCPLANTLYTALVRRLGRLLEEDDATRDRFYKHRDAALEVQAESALRTFFREEAEVLVSVCEQPTGKFEHDTVVLWRDTAFVVEDKASPPLEPFRDVERAFTRLERAFRSKSGIQKAYEQGMRLVREFESGREVVLYDGDGGVVRRVAPGEVRRAFAVCVTADDFGPLALDLTHLLRKPAKEPYPWAVNIFDLEAFLEALRLKGWGPAELARYLEQRSRLHGRVAAGDELEITGMFLRHGRLPAPREGAFLQINPRYSDVFDDIWRAKNGGPAADLTTRNDLEVTDGTEEIRARLGELQGYARGLDLGAGGAGKVGRNERCPCGSGIKYKNCHGRAGGAVPAQGGPR